MTKANNHLLLLAVAGAGKTTYIVEKLITEKYKHALVLTYTNLNRDNILSKIRERFNGIVPENIRIDTLFSFLFNFFYKPLEIRDNTRRFPKAKNIIFENNSKRTKKGTREHYLNNNGDIYHYRLSDYIRDFLFDEAIARVQKYFDVIFIDEVQDLGGGDLMLMMDLLEKINIDVLCVGDYYQMTYASSNDGTKGRGVRKSFKSFTEKFYKINFTVDTTTLSGSWRCPAAVCNFARILHPDIKIHANNSHEPEPTVKYITDKDEISKLLHDKSIIKLIYKEANKYKNRYDFRIDTWGNVKGVDSFNEVCIILTKTVNNGVKQYYSGKSNDELLKLTEITRNKFYVALTRARGNVYLLPPLDKELYPIK